MCVVQSESIIEAIDHETEQQLRKLSVRYISHRTANCGAGRGEVAYYTPSINNNKFFMSFQWKSLYRISCC